MPSSNTAEIIPFPGHAPNDPADHLRTALAALDDALERQRGAIADWRFSLAALNRSAHAVGGWLADYHGSLGTLGRRVGKLQRTLDPRAE